MKKLLSIILAVVVLMSSLFILTGCDNNNNNGDNEENMNIDYKNMTAEDLLSKIVKDRNKVTVDEYVKLISTYSNVEIKEDLTIDDNITDEALDEIDSKAAPKLADYLEKLLTSEYPQVRGYGISLIYSLTGVSDKNIELAKNLIKDETNTYVLYKATKALSNEAKSAPEIAEFLKKMAKHENATIRAAAASALGNYWSKGVDGAAETIIMLMKDSDTEVRKIACKNAGDLGDESVIEPLVGILNNADDADLHGSCIEGLVSLWYDYPSFRNTSEKAYNATMDYLKKTPRTEKIPAWTAVGSFKTTSSQNSFTEWKQKATYFNTDDIYNIMVDIIKDADASYLARTSAIDVIKSHCSEEKFKELKSVVDGLSDSKAKQVISSYDNKAK